MSKLTLDEQKQRQQDYWKTRMEQLEQSLHKDAEETVRDLESMYRAAERQIDSDLSRWYGRFANNNGVVSMADARKLLTSAELKEFKWTLAEYREKAKDNADGKWQKELENVSARWHVSRLEALKYQLQQTVEVLAGGQLDALDSLLKNTYLNGYGQTAFTLQSGIGIGFDIAGLNGRAVQTLLNKPWALDGRNFSERIWGNKQVLIGELHKQLTQNLMTGGDLNKLIDSLSQKFNTSRSNAARLVYTEHAYAVSVATGESYRATGVQKVVFIATLDERTSEICQSMDGTIIDMKDYAPGQTVPPLHPYCRSTTAPYYADMAGIGERAARDPETGKTYYVPKEMKYPEWKEAFLKDPDTGETGSKEGLKEAVPGAILSLADCKTVQDVENLMKQQGWFNVQTIRGTVYDTNATLSLEGCDFEVAKGIYEALDNMFTKFPELTGKLNSLGTAQLKASTYAQCSMGLGHGGVTINRKWFSDLQKIAKSYTRDVAAGFHPVGTDWKSIITHEFGHAVDDLLTKTYLAAGTKNAWGVPKQVSAELRPKVMRACGLKVNQTRSAVSEYATKDCYEWFAEGFAEALDSASPRPVATELMKQLTEIIRKVVK